MAESKQAKYRRYLRTRGIGAFTSAAQVTAHVKYLYTHPDGGMTCQSIADASGVAMSTVSELQRGTKTTVRVTTADKLMACEYRGIDTAHGAWMDPTGTRRRIEALYTIGFSCPAMAEVMGQANPRVVWNYLHNTYMTAMVVMRVKVMYEKLRYADPADFNVAPQVSTRNKNMAAKRNWAPPHCWDDDSIDNPDVGPEWTGACGSARGWRIHYKEGILPACVACKEAKAKDKKEHRGN